MLSRRSMRRLLAKSPCWPTMTTTSITRSRVFSSLSSSSSSYREQQPLTLHPTTQRFSRQFSTFATVPQQQQVNTAGQNIDSLTATLYEKLDQLPQQTPGQELNKQIYDVCRLFREWISMFRMSAEYSDTQLENVLLKTIKLTSMLTDPNESVLKTQSAFEEAWTTLFESAKSQMNFDFLVGKHFQPEDVVPVFLQQTEIYETLFHIYTKNGYPEQTYELLETIRTQNVIAKRQESLRVMYEEAVKKGKEDMSQDKQQQEADGMGDSSSNTIAESNVQIDTAAQQQQQDATYTTSEAPEKRRRQESPEVSMQQDVLKAQQEILANMLTNDEAELDIPVFTKLETYNNLIDSCADIGKIKLVISIYHFMLRNDIPVTRETYEKIIGAFIPHGHVAGALHFLEEMSNRHVRPTASTCVQLMRCLLTAKDARFKSVYEGFLSSGVQPDEALFKQYITCLCKITGDVDVALAQLDANAHRSDLNIDVELYNLVLESCIEYGHTVRGLEVYSKIMDEENNGYLAPNMRTFNFILQLFASKGDARALALFMKWQRESHNADSIYAQFKPDTDTYNALIQMHIQNHDLESAKSIFQLMKSQGVPSNVISHNLMISLLQTTSWRPKLERELAKDKSIFNRFVSANSRSQQNNSNNDPFLFDSTINESEHYDPLLSEDGVEMDDAEFTNRLFKDEDMPDEVKPSQTKPDDDDEFDFLDEIFKK